MKEFLEMIEKNPELKARIEELKDRKDITPEMIIGIAKEYGIELTEEDFDPRNNELSEDELAKVTGGLDVGLCACGFGGYGGSNGLDCMCAIVGEGFVDGEWEDGGCFCTMFGAGDSNPS